MYKYSSSPGISEESLFNRAEMYKAFSEGRVEAGHLRPVGEGVLIWN